MEVEAHVQSGVPAFTLVGLADRACQEAKQRVRSGIKSAQLEWPGNKSTVNLAPAELKKEGSGFDLPIALALLAASGQIPRERLGEHASCGELALDGRLRRVGGVLGVAEGHAEPASSGSSAPMTPARRQRSPASSLSACVISPRQSPTSAARPNHRSSSRGTESRGVLRST